MEHANVSGTLLRSSDSDDDTAVAGAAPASEELFQSTAIWNRIPHHPDTNNNTLGAQTKPDFDFENDLSPTSSARSSIIALSSAAASDSDFEVLDSDQDIPQTDGRSEYNNSAEQSNTLSELLARTRNHAKKSFRRASAALPEIGLPGTASMEAGGSSSGANYDDSDWQQAGQNADAVDLAGPGAQGCLECKVSSPQKEGEGTQNAYISYLVTTEV